MKITGEIGRNSNYSEDVNHRGQRGSAVDTFGF